MSGPTISLYDLLEELRARDETIDSLVVAYFKLEKAYEELKAVVDRKAIHMGGEGNQVARLLDRTHGQQSRDGLSCG